MAKSKKTDSEPALGYEAQLWQTADALRNFMAGADKEHVVLGLLLLQYISDAEAKHLGQAAQFGAGANTEVPEVGCAAGSLGIPREARLQHLKGATPQPMERSFST